MNDFVIMALAALGGWLVVTVLVPPVAWFCHRYGVLDRPGSRKIHTVPTPRLTGVALFAALWGVTIGAAFLMPGRMAEFHLHAIPILVGAVLVLVLGIIDDMRSLGWWTKLGGQLLAGVPLWYAGIGFTRLWIPMVGAVDLGFWSLPVSMLWFLVFLNAVNIIDGVDGLATATSAVATMTLIWVNWSFNLSLLWIASAGLLGALVGFWRFNRPPASVFMGDSGSLSLGYFFAVVALLAPIKRFTAMAFLVPLAAMLLPLTESVFSIGRRSLSGKSPFRADIGHLHHFLLASGWPPGRIVMGYAIVTAVFGAFSVAMIYGNRRVLAAAFVFFVLLLVIGLGIISHQQRTGGGARSDAQPVDEE